ncbi:MAG: hypothetical protein ACOZBW_06685 [Thermodesulfobacteriota bacterium]
MKKRFIVLMVLLLAAVPLAAGPAKFSAEQAGDPAVFVKKNLSLDAKKLKKLGVKKLVILECYGEYVTSKEVTDSVASQRSAMRTAASQGRMFYNVKTQVDTLELDKDYYTNTSNRVYQAIKEAFEANGIEIIGKEAVQQNEAYKTFNLEEEKAGRGVSSGVYKPTVVEKSQKVSTTGLGLFPGAIQMIKVVMNLGEITHSLGADGFLQVNFKVDKDKESRPVLEAFNVLLSADLRGQEVGFQGNKSMRYDFYIQWQPVVKLKSPLVATAEVLEGKKGPFNIEKYDAALMEMLYAVTDGIKSEILK